MAIVPRFLYPVERDPGADTDDLHIRAPSEADGEPVELVALTPSGGMVILGEPGMGKTTALAQLRSTWQASGRICAAIEIDLEEVRDTAAFSLRVTRRLHAESQLTRPAPGHDSTSAAPSPHAITPRASTPTEPGDTPDANGQVLVVFDNVDRCALGPKALGASLAELLGEVNTSRICLLAACRATDWSQGLEVRLRGLLPGFTAMRLAPLRPADVAAMAADHGVDPAQFLEAVTKAGAWPLAVIPNSALLLISLFRAERTLPSQPAALYEQGLELLAAEPDEEWARSRRTDGAVTLSGARRMAIAARISAWTQLCGYTSVLVAPSRLPAPTELPVSQLIGGSEPCPGGELAVDEASLGDALGCALFTGGRAARRVLRHESFTAYLAARHLVHRGVPEAQLRGVLLSSSRTGAKVHPMLRETAAWLVALDPVAHRWLAQADAETVASYPYAIAQDEVKASLIDGLLDLADADLLRNRSLSDLWIGQLTHPGLVDQLRAALRVGSAERGRAAAVIAQETGETRLVDDLVAVALDPARQTALRVRAVLSANALDHGRAAKMLRPLMTDTPHELDDELRGAVLDALWPQALGVEELVAAMTRETRPTVLDLYALFRLRLPERLSDADLPIVLAWAAARPGHRDGRPQHTGARRDDQLLNRLITRAWSARDRAPLLPALADLVHEQLLNDLHYEVAPPLQCSTDTDERDRRALARLLAERAASLNDAARLAHAPLARALGLLQPADLDWLLDRESQADETDAPRWHVLIRAIFSPADPGHRHSAESRRGSRVWQQVLGPMLDARTAPPAIPAHRVDDRRHAANGQPPLDRAAARQQNLTTLQALLQKTETGDPDGFWRLCWLMQADPDTAVILTWWSDDVTARPGYRALAEQHPDLLDRLIEAADAYLRVQHPHTDDWIDATNVTSWPAQAGYLAFALMDRHAPERLHSLEPAVWHRWAPALLGFGAAADNAGEPERKRRLLSLLGQRAPSAISQPAVRLLRAAASGPAADELRFTTACWSSELADALAAELPGLRAAPNLANFDLALRLLLEQGHAATRLYALQAVRDDATQRDEQAGRHAALGLLYTQPAAAWPEIFTQMRSRPAWGRALAEDIATSYEPFDPLSELDDVQLGALYGWLLEQFPPEQDIWPTEVGFRTAQHDTRFWRERGLKHLTARGTLSAIDALSVLALGNPHRPWLRRALAEAQENHRATCWNPISLRELRALIKDARRRHLRDSGDLLEAVMAELARLQQNMRGTTPEAGFLWDEQRATNAASRWFPKREADLSDYVAKHLRAHLPAVFTNREVEITRAAVGVGERVDLLCQATTMDPSGAATCQIVIEVKGCWNEHLLTGLHDQLAADYMATTGTRHGIYLVGWYPKDQWDRADSRRSKAPSGTAGHLHDELEQRAALEREESQLEIHVIVLDLRRHERAARTRATSRDRQTKSA